MKIFKNKKKASIRVLALLLMFIVGCTEEFDEINIPKDQIIADDIDGTLLGAAFAQAQHYGLNGDDQAFQRSHSLFSDEYAQYFATTEPNFDSGNFVEIQGWTNRYFRDVYNRAAPQLLFVEQFTGENSMPAANAIAKVWRVEMYHRISDFFGPIIYSEFGNGQTKVAYDCQEDVYHDFFKVLDEAVAVLEQHQGENAFGSHDLIYGGDVDQWLTFANSLRLRLAMRIVYVEPELARQEAEKAVRAGVMVNNSDNANVLTTVNSLNFYASITYIDEFRMSASMDSGMTGYNDPRIDDYFDEAAVGGGYEGLRNGLPRIEKGSFLDPVHSFIDISWRPLASGGTNPPNKVMAASELYFLRAEGALRGWEMGGTAEELYNEGIRTSMSEDRVTASDEEIESYIVSTNTPVPTEDLWESPAMTDIPVLYQSSSDFETQLEKIITQKWIALYPDSWEAWSERRRTGYPVGYALVESFNPDVSEKEMMRRLKFTTGEISTNFEAVEAGRACLDGPDTNYTRLWWDAKPISEFPTPVD
jgi:hypothetical protein